MILDIRVNNLFKTMTLLLFGILFGYGIDLFTYDYIVVNETGRDVKVQLRHAYGNLNNDYLLIEKGKEYTFSFGGIKADLCLDKIVVAIKDSAGAWGTPKEAEILGIPEITGVVSKFALCGDTGFILRLKGTKIEAHV